MRRLPIRARLTAVFAAAMVVVLAGAGVFVYVRLQDDLDEAVGKDLAARADAVDEGRATVGEPEEAFAQLLARGGRVVSAEGAVTAPVLTPAEAAAAERGPLVLERRVAGVDGTARMLARPAATASGAAVAVAGQSLDDRDEALSGLVTTFAIGGPAAVLLASLLGYALASAALRPVEAMRRRASAVSLSGEQERLPLPAARDEVRRLGETLNEMLDRLRVSFDRERQFVADASHELRTPVAVIKTELETLLRTPGLEPAVHEGVLAAAEEADHLAQLAEDLLVLARAADGRLPVRRERLDVIRVLEDARERFADRAAALGRRIEVRAPADLRLDADPMRLRQALGNLLDNGLRHGAGDVVLSAGAADGGVEIAVADAGTGFDPGLGDRVFERFTRGDEARTRGGAGLGLAIVRAVAEGHGGHAAVTSPAGAGARVALWLPAPDSQAHLSGGSHDGQRPVHRPPGGAA